MRQSLRVLLCLLILGCGGEETIFNVLPPGEPPPPPAIDVDPVPMSAPLFAAISLVNELASRCESAPSALCDGHFDDRYGVRFFVNVAGDTDNNGQYAVIIDPDGGGPLPSRFCASSNVGGSASQTERAIVTNINTPETGCNASGIAIAHFGSVYVIPLLETVTFSTNVAVGSGGNAGSMSQTNVTFEDVDALPGFFDTIVTSDAQDIVDCNLAMKPAAFATGDCDEVFLPLTEEVDTQFERIGVQQAAGCTNFATGGAIRVTSELAGTVTAAGMLAPAADWVLTDTIAFENCRFDADFGLGGGSTATTVTITGEVVRTTVHVPIASPATPLTVTLEGALSFDGDIDGSMDTTDDTIWEDGIEFGATEVDDGSSTTYGGGVCLGGALNVTATDCETIGVFSAPELWFP